jgi:hypothetical protein
MSDQDFTRVVEQTGILKTRRYLLLVRMQPSGKFKMCGFPRCGRTVDSGDRTSCSIAII